MFSINKNLNKVKIDGIAIFERFIRLFSNINHYIAYISINTHFVLTSSKYLATIR